MRRGGLALCWRVHRTAVITGGRDAAPAEGGSRGDRGTRLAEVVRKASKPALAKCRVPSYQTNLRTLFQLAAFTSAAVLKVLFWILHGLFFIYKFIYFIYLFLVVLGLHCCMWAFSGCGERGLLLVVVRGLLIAVASLVAEHGL